MHSFWLILLLSICSYSLQAQVTANLSNPSACGLAIHLSDYSCPENSPFYNPDIFQINVNNAPGTVLGQDVYLSEVRILLEHEWLSDVRLVLKSPGGQSATLLSNTGGNGQHLGDTMIMNCGGAMRFQLASCLPIAAGADPFTAGPYRAEEDFYVFNDNTTNPNGAWELEICDDLQDDTGILQFVELVFLPLECLPVQDVELVSQDTTAATFSYTPHIAGDFIVEIGASGFTPGTAANAGQGQVYALNTNPFTLTNLSEDTDYDIYIRRSCNGGTSFSPNSCVSSFKTGCNPVAFTERTHFDDQSTCSRFCTANCELTSNWRNISDDDFDWIAASGPTATLHTGPDDDVTTGGVYLYMEANGGQCATGAEAILQSACFTLDKQGSDTCHVSFSYHMQGLNIGTLSVLASDDGGISWDPIWSATGPQSADWQKAYLGLGDYTDGSLMQLRIVVAKGNGIFGDIAIDQIQLHGSSFSAYPSNYIYADADMDGYGDVNTALLTCLATAPANYAFNGDDCDDTNPNIHPGATEIACNGIDENCNAAAIDDDINLPIATVYNDTICSGETAVLQIDVPLNFHGIWYTEPDKSSGIVGIGTDFSPTVPENNTAFIQEHLFYAEITDFICFSTALAVAKVVVLPRPNGQITTATPAICLGESVDLASVNIIDQHFTSATLSFHSGWPTTATNELAATLVSPQLPTNYYYRLESPDACYFEDTLLVDIKSGPALSFSPADTFSLCREHLDTIRVTATGGLAPYTYLWNTGRNTTEQPVQGDYVAGTTIDYSLTVTDAEACFTVDTVRLSTTNSIDSLSVNTQDVSTCNGADGSITIIPLNGTAPFAYQWENGDGQSGSQSAIMDTIRINNLIQNAYHLTITDSSPEACEVFLRNIRVQGPGFQLSDTDLIPPSCAGFADGEICLDVSGAAGLTYTWSDGQMTACASNLTAGDYSVTISNGDCSMIEEYTLTAPDLLSLKIDHELPTCHDATDGALRLSVFGGTPNYTYAWDTGVMIEDLVGIGQGTYEVTITDANLCVLDTQIMLNAPALLSITLDTLVDVSCSGEADAWLRMQGQGGTQPYSYLWEDASVSAQRTALAVGTYHLTVTDFNNCTATRSVEISEPDVLSLSLLNTEQPICRGDATGGIELAAMGGTAPYEFVWNDALVSTNALRTNMEVGDYWVLVKDQNNCMSDTLFITLTPASSLSISSAIVSPTCVGLTNGSITINAGGVAPLSYQWSNGATTQNLQNIGVGEYCVTVTDDRLCVQDTCFYVDAPQVFAISSSVSQPACFGEDNGIIDQTFLAQGTPPFHFVWNDASQHVDRFFLAPGDYSFTATDDLGCAFTSDTFTIAYPEPLNLDVLDQGGINCYGDATGYIEVYPSGGNAPYAYNWVGTGVTSTGIYNQQAGDYSLIITDANNCTIDTVLSIDQVDSLMVDIDLQLGNVCEADAFDEIISIASGGSMPYAYEWTTGQTTVNLINPSPGDYAFTLTDANNCVAVSPTVKVKERIPALVLDSFVVQQVSCFEGSDAVMSAYTSGGSNELLYHFSPTYIEQTDANEVHVNGLNYFQNYSVTITDEKTSCAVSSDLIAGIQPTAITIERDSFSQVECFGGADGSLYVSVQGGTSPYSYLWTDQDGNYISDNEDLPYAAAGIHNLLVTDDKGCTMSFADSNVVAINTPLVLTTEVGRVSCKDGTDGFIDISLEGGVPPYEYEWSNDATTEDIDMLDAGFYTLTVTDSDTCRTIFTAIQISEPDIAMSMTAMVDSVSCFDGNDGTISVDVQGGEGEYTYRWRRNTTLLPAFQTGSIDDLIAATYLLSVRDTNDCVLEEEFILLNPEELIATIVNTPAGSTTLNVEVSGGRPPYMPMWSNGSDDFTIDMLEEGMYEVLITDDKGCEATDAFLLTNISSIKQQAQDYFIYPNPSASSFSIKALADPFAEASLLQIYSSNGQLVHQQSNNQMSQNLVVDKKLAKGVYQLLLMSNGDLRYLGRVVVVD